MSIANAPSTVLRIAIPYYGQRIMPRFGLARQFCLITADLQQGRIDNLIEARWDPVQEPSVARWLRRNAVAGVICDGIHPRFQTALKTEGLWILWGIWGELDEVLQRWLDGNLPLANAESLSGCCRPAAGSCRNGNCPTPNPRR